jgi:hypothetical protein
MRLNNNGVIHAQNKFLYKAKYKRTRILPTMLNAHLHTYTLPGWSNVSSASGCVNADVTVQPGEESA